MITEACAGLASACVNEPIDRGAGYSTFDLIRDAGPSDGVRSMRSALPPPENDPHATQEFVAADPDYAWSTQVDGFGLEQVVQLLGAAEGPPQLLWWNTTLTGSVLAPVYHRTSRTTCTRSRRTVRPNETFRTFPGYAAVSSII